jgi:ketosteroid isomerase-like protein
MADTMLSPTETVSAWHEAVNAKDIEAAVDLCAPDVAVTGPKGTGHGQDLMRAWLQRSGIRLEPQHPLEERGGRILVHERAQWSTTADAPAQAPTSAPVDTWVVFRAAGGQVTEVARHETEEDALRSVASVT